MGVVSLPGSGTEVSSIILDQPLRKGTLVNIHIQLCSNQGEGLENSSCAPKYLIPQFMLCHESRNSDLKRFLFVPLQELQEQEVFLQEQEVFFFLVPVLKQETQDEFLCCKTGPKR